MSYNTTQHWYTCTDSDCSDKIDIEDHSWDNGVITKQPTETSTGVKTFTCTVCGATKTATLEKLEHVHKAGSTWEHTSTHHYHLCSCGQTMDVAAHVWNNGVETTPATTTSTGVKTYTCTICNATRTETIPMLHSHKAQNTWYSDADNHWQKCSCNEIMNQSTHRWDAGVITKEPTETTTGVRTYTCSVCGRTRTETVNKLEHTHRANSKYEHDNSNHWNECNCGEKMNIENHSWSKGVITKEPTEESTGEIKYTCNVCGAVKLLTLDKLEHVHKQTDGWLYDDAKHWYNCSCGEKFNVSLHDWNEGTVTKEPSVSEYGERTFVCTTCGKTRIEYIDKVVPGHEHNAKGDYVTDNSNHWKECDCGEKVDIASHISDNGVVTLQPTETSEGIMTYSCSICGYILRTETIPANTPVHTHNYGTAWYYDSTCHWHECSCGDRSNIGQHISNGGIVTVQPTATSTGLRVYSCSVCGYVLRTETIPATGYNYPNYPTYPTYPTYPFDSSIFNVVTFTDKVNITAETEGNTITIKWDKVEKADKYYVYQYKNGKYVKVKTTSDTSATFKKLKNGETYKFLVRYTKSGRLSPTKYSGTISVKVYYKPIPKPTATKNSIKLTWEAVPDAEKYAIYKYVDGKAVKLTETKKLSVKIGKLIPDTEYKYIVRAYVDGKWTTMLKSDIVTVKTKAE